MANSNISNESPIETDETPQKEKIYDGVKLGILAENGHIRRATIDSFCRLEISPSTNYKTYVNIYKGIVNNLFNYFNSTPCQCLDDCHGFYGT